MNLLRRELRAGIKPFILWNIGLFVLSFAGMTKYNGFESASGAINISELLDKFPRVVLAVIGMVGVDINTLGGYFAAMSYYALICVAIYAVHLGIDAVSRETIDKTYEFLFTKPRTRTYVLGMKLLAAWIFLLATGVLNYLYSASAISALGIRNDIQVQMVLFAITIFLIASLFLSISAFVAAAVKQADRGALMGNLFFVFAFIMGTIYDMLENGGILKIFSPLKYFAPADLLEKQIDPLFAGIALALIALLLWRSFSIFSKKDMLAV